MADYKSTILYDVDLDKGNTTLKVELPYPLYTEDHSAHKVGVRVFRDGKAVDLTGATVTGYFRRPPKDESSSAETVILNGTADGNTAACVFNQYCYPYRGPFAFVLKISTTSMIHALLGMTGTILPARTTAIVDDSNVIPSLDDLLKQVEVMRTATAESKQATSNANAATTAANSAAKSANDAASAATTAAKSASDAASTANAAAKSATDAAADTRNAISQAKEAASNANAQAEAVTAAGQAATDAAAAANEAARAATTAAGNATDAAQTANTVAAKLDGLTVSAVDGTTAKAEISEVDDHKSILFTLPIGKTPALTFLVTTGAPGTEAEVTAVTGTAEAPVIHLTIPRGDTGSVNNLDALLEEEFTNRDLTALSDDQIDAAITAGEE